MSAAELKDAWQADVPFPAEFLTVANDGDLLLSGRNTLGRFSVDKKKITWSVQDRAIWHPAPLLHHGNWVILGHMSSIGYFDYETGEHTIKTASDHCYPVIEGDLLLRISEASAMSFSLAGKKPKRLFQVKLLSATREITGDVERPKAVVANGHVWFTSRRNNLCGVNIETGEQIVYGIGRPQLSDIVVHEGVGYFGTTGGMLGVELATGKITLDCQLVEDYYDRGYSRPVIHDDVLFTSVYGKDRDGIFRIDLKTGKELSMFIDAKGRDCPHSHRVYIENDHVFWLGYDRIVYKHLEDDDPHHATALVFDEESDGFRNLMPSLSFVGDTIYGLGKTDKKSIVVALHMS